MTFDYLINEAVVQTEQLRQEAQHSGQIQKAYGIEIATKIFMDLAADQRDKNLVLKKEDVIRMQDEIARLEALVNKYEHEAAGGGTQKKPAKNLIEKIEANKVIK